MSVREAEGCPFREAVWGGGQADRGTVGQTDGRMDGSIALAAFVQLQAAKATFEEPRGVGNEQHGCR